MNLIRRPEIFNGLHLPVIPDVDLVSVRLRKIRGRDLAILISVAGLAATTILPLYPLMTTSAAPNLPPIPTQEPRILPTMQIPGPAHTGAMEMYEQQYKGK